MSTDAGPDAGYDSSACVPTDCCTPADFAPADYCAPADCCIPVECCAPTESVPGSGTVDEAAAAELAATLKVLADPVRLRLLGMLATAPTGEVCACDLVEPLGRTQPTISYHLKALRGAGLVHARRRGTWIWYSVNGETVEATAQALRAATTPADRIPVSGIVLIS